jgi:hypothetical protein
MLALDTCNACRRRIGAAKHTKIYRRITRRAMLSQEGHARKSAAGKKIIRETKKKSD